MITSYLPGTPCISMYGIFTYIDSFSTTPGRFWAVQTNSPRQVSVSVSLQYLIPLRQWSVLTHLSMECL